MGRVNLTELLFADDMELIAKTERNLHDNINILNQELNDANMNLNALTMKTWSIAEENRKHNITMQVSIFKYPGITRQ